jgi:hypothetical protein
MSPVDKVIVDRDGHQQWIGHDAVDEGRVQCIVVGIP